MPSPKDPRIPFRLVDHCHVTDTRNVAIDRIIVYFNKSYILLSYRMVSLTEI